MSIEQSVYEGMARRIESLEAQLVDWKALHTAIATGQPIWPNNWAQEVAMVAHEVHTTKTQLANAQKLQISEELIRFLNGSGLLEGCHFVDGLCKTNGNGPGNGSMLVAWGSENVATLQRVRERGHLMLNTETAGGLV